MTMVTETHYAYFNQCLDDLVNKTNIIFCCIHIERLQENTYFLTQD